MEADKFSPEALDALNQEDFLLPSVANVTPKHKVRQTEPFLRGPVPMSWIKTAHELGGGNGLRLGISLWWVSGMNGSRMFPVNISKLEAGQSLRSKRRVLKILEDAGLIKRIHEPGKRLKVELLVAKQEARGPP